MAHDSPARFPLRQPRKRARSISRWNRSRFTNGAVKLTGHSLATPRHRGRPKYQRRAQQIRSALKASPSAYNFAGNLGSGGPIAVKGNLDLEQSQVTSDVSIRPGRFACAPGLCANRTGGHYRRGVNLTPARTLLTSFAANQFNPARLNRPASPSTISRCTRRATRKSRCNGRGSVRRSRRSISPLIRRPSAEVHADRIHLFVRRGRDGKLSLLSLLRLGPGRAPENSKRSPRRRQSGAARDRAHGRRAAPRTSRRLARRAAPASPRGEGASRGREWHYKIRVDRD